MAKDDLVTYNHPRHGTKMQSTKALRDIITGKTQRTGPTVLSQEDTRAPYQLAGAVEAPARNASTDEWRDYRLAHGYTDGDVDGMSRDDLRDLEDR